MQLQEVNTIQDLKKWVIENMPNADVYEDMYGTLVIRTNLGVAGRVFIRHKREAE